MGRHTIVKLCIFVPVDCYLPSCESVHKMAGNSSIKKIIKSSKNCNTFFSTVVPGIEDHGPICEIPSVIRPDFRIF